MQVFENILERLQEKAIQAEKDIGLSDTSNEASASSGMWIAFDEAISIVQDEVKKYNNGWIPTSERMPEEHDSMFATLKGTDKWNDAMFEKTSDVVNVTVVDKKGKAVTTRANTVDGKWNCDLLRLNKSYQITHWQPKPEPYQPKEE